MWSKLLAQMQPDASFTTGVRSWSEISMLQLHETFQTPTSPARSSKDPSLCQLHLRSAKLRSHHLEVAAYGDPRAMTLLLMPNTLEQ
ncbi:hypothetical protein V1478_015884 [Vespula squamosa]|uniref:Uncharacterized protein n=1 Tax=Vespula squamosa TaxID=30214 RepID=A0ABD2A259_VESSQ